MNAFAAESAAWKIKVAGNDIETEATAIVLMLKLAPNSHVEIADRIASIRKMIFAAEKAVEELKAAIGEQLTGLENG